MHKHDLSPADSASPHLSSLLHIMLQMSAILVPTSVLWMRSFSVLILPADYPSVAPVSSN